MSMASVSLDGAARLPVAAWRPMLADDPASRWGAPHVLDDGRFSTSNHWHYSLPLVDDAGARGSYALAHDSDGDPTADNWYGEGPLSMLGERLEEARRALETVMAARRPVAEGMRLQVQEAYRRLSDPSELAAEMWRLRKALRPLTTEQSDAQERVRDAQLRVFHPRFAIDTGRVRRGDPRGVAAALTFLAVDPYCFSSGYRKRHLLESLRRMPLSDDHRARVRELVVHGLRDRGGESRGSGLPLPAR